MRDERSRKPDPQTDYEKAEADLLKKTLRESNKDRFFRKTGLYRIQKTMEKAFVTHWSSRTTDIEQKNDPMDNRLSGRGAFSPDDPAPSR